MIHGSLVLVALAASLIAQTADTSRVSGTPKCQIAFRVVDQEGKGMQYEVRTVLDSSGVDHAGAFSNLVGSVPCSVYSYVLKRSDGNSAAADIRGKIVAVREAQGLTAMSDPNLVIDRDGTVFVRSILPTSPSLVISVRGRRRTSLWARLDSLTDRGVYETPLSSDGTFKFFEPTMGLQSLHVFDGDSVVHAETLLLRQMGKKIEIVLKDVPESVPVRIVE